MLATESTIKQSFLPSPIVVRRRDYDVFNLLDREWLLSNRIGAYASSSVIGCNTRRYHGLLVATTCPPTCRVVTLSQVIETVTVAGKPYEIGTGEFPNTLSPRGWELLEEFRNDMAATFVFRAGGAEIVKEVVLAETSNTVSIRYRVSGAAVQLALRPFAALRDFHGLRQFSNDHQVSFDHVDGVVRLRDGRRQDLPALCLWTPQGVFEPAPDWWYRFHYRADLARGQEAFEDLYTPGLFRCEIPDGGQCVLTAALGEPIPLDVDTTLSRRRERLELLAKSVGPSADVATRRLAVASDAFVVQRRVGQAAPCWTILAGFPWFADWGRDTFISLPGLLLETGRFAEARGIFRLFAEYVADGIVPNRFDDYSPTAHYNSIDASLWFIMAAERFLQATDDREFWKNTLLPAMQSILRSFHDGTRFDIHADTDELLCGGSAVTQLTWMDAKLGSEAITPRHGKAVEVNALWYNAHRLLAERCRGVDDDAAETYAKRAALIWGAFERTFWNEQAGCLYDCVTSEYSDGSIRPNQIFAVSLPHSPLSQDKQKAIVRVVTDQLLTPMGLRTLSSDDPRYRRRYGGSWESRDRAYHQGTVWAWLMGAYIEAYLRVEEYKPFAVAKARALLEPFDKHLEQAALGTISEIFDGDAPHGPRGCFAQAWSVAEILRARKLIESMA